VSAANGAFTMWWADRYTRKLPDEVRDRRRAEIESDVFEHVHLASESSDARRTSVAWRTVRGIPADVAWRRQEMRAMRANSPEPHESPLRNAWAVVTQRWFAPIAILVLVFDVLFAIAVLKEGKSSGQVIGPILLTLCAVAIGTGLWLRWRAVRVIASRPAPTGATLRAVSNRTIAAIFAVLGITLALLVIGVSTGAVSVFFVGLGLLVIAALVFGVRAVVRAVRSSDVADRAGLADGLIIVGTFPALAMFWMIVPPILALLVIGGVLGTSPKFRPAA
jgi:hypothetical protein